MKFHRSARPCCVRILLLALPFILFSSSNLVAAPARAGWKKVFIRAVGGAVPADFAANNGGEVVAQYPSYEVARFPDSAITNAASQAATLGLLFIVRDEFDKIFLPGRVLDARIELQPSDYAPGTTGLYILQFIAPAQKDWITGVQSSGAHLIQYIPENSYLMLATPEMIGSLRQLGFVQWISRVASDMKNQHFARTSLERVDILVDIAASTGTDAVVATLRQLNVGDFVVYPELQRTRVRCNILAVDASALLENSLVIGMSTTPHNRISDERQAISVTSNVTTSGTPLNPTTYSTWLSQRCSFCTSLNSD